jgi:hypothetical protein
MFRGFTKESSLDETVVLGPQIALVNERRAGNTMSLEQFVAISKLCNHATADHFEPQIATAKESEIWSRIRATEQDKSQRFI